MKREVPWEKGFALPMCLFTLVILSVLVLAFIFSASSEARSSAARCHAEQARMAAESAIGHACGLLRILIKTYPDSVSAWSRFPSVPTAGTTLFFRSTENRSLDLNDLPPAALPSDFFPSQPQLTIYGWPLISGAAGQQANQLSSAFAEPLTKENSVNLNRRRRIDPDGQPINAQWIVVGRNPHSPLQWDSRLPDHNPPVIRYAFWVDDESFRVNLQTSSAKGRGKSEGRGPEEISLGGLLRGVAADPEREATEIEILRNRLGGQFPSFETIAFASDPPANLFADKLRFHSTLYSASYDVMRSGARRVNLNEVLSSSSPIRTRLDRIIRTILYRAAAPNFGQRFYRDVTAIASAAELNQADMVLPDHAEIYLQKFAANVNDYVDADSQPTIIERDEGYPVRPPAVATSALEADDGKNPAAAIGKENIPRLQEYAVHARLLKMDPVGWSQVRGSATFEFTLDHYLEFWNMGTRDIVLSGEGDAIGNDAVLVIYNQPSFGAAGVRGGITPPIPEGRRIMMPLKNARSPDGSPFCIPAGECVVLTTDPAPNPALLGKSAKVYTLPVSQDARRFRGVTTDYSDDKAWDGERVYNHTYRVVVDSRSNQDNDYETRMFLGNNRGLIESFSALPLVRGRGYALSIHAGAPDHIKSDKYFVRGGNLRGNSGTAVKGFPASTSGDPRSLNEQLDFSPYEAGNVLDSTRFYWNGLDNDSVPARSSMGLKETSFVLPDRWPDATSTKPGALHAPVWIKNAPLTSIGELGHLYDPARIRGTAPSVTLSRGGGRTFRIGQPEQWHHTDNPAGLWDGEALSASRTWAAWRLADFFTVSDRFRLSGTVNPNGILRDNGKAFRAMLDGLRFRDAPEGGRGISGSALTEEQIQDFIRALIRRFGGNNPDSPDDDQIFWERGEISESAFLESPSFSKVAQSGDRGREEINRRLIEMLAVRGNVFRVHAMGQAIQCRPDGSIRVLSTRERMVIVELQPIFSESVDDSFDPSDSDQVDRRFAAPDDYRIVVRWTEG